MFLSTVKRLQLHKIAIIINRIKRENLATTLRDANLTKSKRNHVRQTLTVINLPDNETVHLLDIQSWSRLYSFSLLFLSKELLKWIYNNKIPSVSLFNDIMWVEDSL